MEPCLAQQIEKNESQHFDYFEFLADGFQLSVLIVLI